MAPTHRPQTLGGFRAALLDMDGTLVDSDAVVERCWRRWATEHGLDPADVLANAHGRQPHTTMALLLPGRSPAENRADGARLVGWEKADTDGIVPVPGAPELLAALAELPHALVTSADAGLATVRMSAAGLRMPEVRITAECVAAGKPDPEGFLAAAVALGCAPRECVVFEDSEAGIAAGLAAGMHVVGVGPRAAAYRPTVQARTLEQVRIEATADGGLLIEVRRGRPTTTS